MNDIAIINLSCKSCGANIKVPPDVDHFNCAYCGTALVVQRGDGYEAKKVSEKLSQSINESGSQTQSTIRESTQVTQLELKRLQLSQQISSLQMQLNSIQSEIRFLERQKSNKHIKRQLRELHTQESNIYTQIQNLQTIMVGGVAAASVGRTSDKKVVGPPISYRGKDWRIAFILCTLFGFFGFHRFYTGRTVSGFIYLFTFGLVGVGWVVDFILLALGKFHDQYKLPLNNRDTHLGKSWLASGVAYFIILFVVLIAINDSTSAIIIALLVGGIAFASYFFISKKAKLQSKNQLENLAK